MKLVSLYAIVFALFFVGCESKPQKAQEVQTSIVTEKKETVNENNLFVPNIPLVSFLLLNHTLLIKYTER